MADEKNESEVTLPMQGVTSAELDAGVEKMKRFQDVLTPPEGQVLVGLRSFCPIHGDITRASKVIKYTVYKKNTDTNEVVAASDSDILCLACLSELWRTKVVANYPKTEINPEGEIRVSPVFLEEEKYQELLKKAEEERKAQLEAQGTEQLKDVVEGASEETASTTEGEKAE
mgnify:CR=1 FL=1